MQFQLVFFTNHEPIDSCQMIYSSIQEARDNLEFELRISTSEIDKVELYTSNDDREQLEYIDEISR